MRSADGLAMNGPLQDFAAKLRQVLSPILGPSTAYEVSNNVAMAYMVSSDMPVSDSMRQALEQRLQYPETYCIQNLSRPMVEEAVRAVRHVQPPMVDNSSRPRGFPWEKNIRVYHATSALERVLDEGLKSRGALDRPIHATGGGPERAISFTMNQKVAFSICLGLRTLSSLARGDMLLMTLVKELRAIAPQATLWKLDEMKLSLDDIARMDRGLYAFAAGYGGGRRGTSVKMDVFERLYADRPGSFEAVELARADPGARPYAAYGWTTRDLVLAMEEGMLYPNPPQENETRHVGFEIYKNVLSMGDMQFKEVYDPFFFLTRPEHLEHVVDEQIGVVSSLLNADWLCADPDSARDLGYDSSGLPRVDTFDWARSCDSTMEHEGHTTHPPSRDWDQPSADDTIVYVGKSMNELRVYNRDLVRGLREEYPMDDVLNEARDAWDAKGKIINDPVAWPFFSPQTRRIR